VQGSGVGFSDYLLGGDFTWGREGFFIYVPDEDGMQSIYSALVGAGVRKMITHLSEDTIYLVDGKIA